MFTWTTSEPFPFAKNISISNLISVIGLIYWGHGSTLAVGGSICISSLSLWSLCVKGVLWRLWFPSSGPKTCVVGIFKLAIVWNCVSVCVCVQLCPVIGWYCVQGVPCLVAMSPLGLSEIGFHVCFHIVWVYTVLLFPMVVTWLYRCNVHFSIYGHTSGLWYIGIMDIKFPVTPSNYIGLCSH